jgi:hypothetical protein
MPQNQCLDCSKPIHRQSTRCRPCTHIKHGYYKSPTYFAWEGMIQRCTNPNWRQWHNYGGRGITVCERWRTFVNFLADMGERPEGRHGKIAEYSLDRIDNNGNYEPGNCRWATVAEQHSNKRRIADLALPRYHAPCGQITPRCKDGTCKVCRRQFDNNRYQLERRT